MIAANEQAYDLKQSRGGSPFVLPNGARLDPEGEQLYRSFDQLPTAQAFSNTDPYEFKVLNPVVGIIGFNPLASIVGAGGPQSSAITARIDYDVDDWHIIQEQQVRAGRGSLQCEADAERHRAGGRGR